MPRTRRSARLALPAANDIIDLTDDTWSTGDSNGWHHNRGRQQNRGRRGIRRRRRVSGQSDVVVEHSVESHSVQSSNDSILSIDEFEHRTNLGHGVLSDSDSDDGKTISAGLNNIPVSLSTSVPTVISITDESDVYDNDSRDLFSVNCDELLKDELRMTFKEDGKTEKSNKCSESEKKKSDIILLDNSANEMLNDITLSSPAESMNDIQGELEECINSRRKKVKRSKQVQMALSSLKVTSKHLKSQVNQIDSLNNSFSDDIVILSDLDDNPEIMVRVKYGKDYFRISLHKLQPLYDLYKQMAAKFSVETESVVLTLHDEVISSTDTPASLGITFADIIECSVISSLNTIGKSAGISCVQDPNEIKLKVQSSCRRDCVELSIGKDAKLLGLMHKYATQKGVELSRLKFFFDGELLNPSETASSLDLEGGECIDVHVNR